MDFVNIIFIVGFMLRKSEAFPNQNPSEDDIREHKSFRRDPQRSKDFIFPTDTPEINYDSYSSKIVFSPRAGSCDDSISCEIVPDYPEHHIRNALRYNSNLKILAIVDEIPMLDQRIDIDISDDEPLCSSEERVIFPQSSPDKSDNWHFVINQNDFRQGIRIERCLNEGSKCKLTDVFNSGYETSCKQKYYYRNVAGVLPNGTVSTFTSKFPSSCCCQVKFSGDPLLRIGYRNESFGLRKSNISSFGTKSLSSSTSRKHNQVKITDFRVENK
ncbi:neurotrophin 1-like isoform X3 [Aphidius gifuensis]|uniref:neurotrophin 1-like isoform X3 n=2 Tax=Aphidius gifuensis TaxID=684658 RepID=UPI001CDBB677|nr:neurotrophin 1-like isoform X3 [Aphidius gifuensis]